MDYVFTCLFLLGLLYLAYRAEDKVLQVIMVAAMIGTLFVGVENVF